MDKLGVALLGFFSAYFVFKKDDKTNQLKYITEERQKWREEIRKLSVAFMSGKFVENDFKNLTFSELRNIREEVTVRLNPDDEEDEYILCLMDCYIKNENNREFIRKELRVAFASLLKHDWERVKNETKMESNSSKLVLILIALLIVTSLFNCFKFIPERVLYLDFKDLQLYEFSTICTIVFLLSTLLLYMLFKYLRWRRKYRFENHLDCCGNPKFIDTAMNKDEKNSECCNLCKVIKNNSKLKKQNCLLLRNKYLGYSIRKRL